jgi:hypothetical protein
MPVIRRARVRLAVTIGVLPVAVGALVGCTSGSGTPIVATAATAPGPTVAGTAEKAAISDALTVYKAYLHAYVTAAATADWQSAAIDRVSADPLRSQAHQILRGYASVGVVLTGAPLTSPQVAKVMRYGSSYAVSLVDCIDSTGWRPVKKATGQSAKAVGQPDRHRVDVTVVQYPDHVWYVQQIVNDPVSTC